MTYNQLQKSFNTEYAIFSVSESNGIHWNKNWNGKKFADKNLPNIIVKKGAWILSYTGWGDLVQKKVIDPSWKDIMEFFDYAIKVGGDKHHVFLEGIEEDGDCLVLLSGS